MDEVNMLSPTDPTTDFVIPFLNGILLTRNAINVVYYDLFSNLTTIIAYANTSYPLQLIPGYVH